MRGCSAVILLLLLLSCLSPTLTGPRPHDAGSIITTVDGSGPEGWVEVRSTRTIFVDDSGGQDHLTIQAAIEAADPGDTIRVFAGVYYENVIIDRAVSLIGNGSADTVIDGGGGGDIVSITSDGVNVRNLTLRDGGKRHTGIHLGDASYCRIRDCLIGGCRNGVLGEDGDYNTVTGCTVENNTRVGIWLAGDGNLVANNTCRYNGRGISVAGRECILTGNIIEINDLGVSLGTFPLEVLLMGNSYTDQNSLDVLLQRLLGKTVPLGNAARLTAGGLTLADHADRAEGAGTTWNVTLNDGKRWDAVVLQDQSQVPGFPTTGSYWQDSLAGAKVLDQMVEGIGADTVLLMTWGRRDGDSMNPGRYPDFTTMQGHLEAGYRMYAENLSATGRPAWIAPAGLAFKHIHDEIVAGGGDPTAQGTLFHDLYASDGSHPSRSGSYLAACVLYAVLTGNSPVGIVDGTSLSATRKLALQEAAAATVFNETPAYSYPWRKATSCLVDGNRFEGTYIGLAVGCLAYGNEVANNSFTDSIGPAVRILDANSNTNIVHHNGFRDNNGGKVQARNGGVDNTWDDDAEGNYWSDYGTRYPTASNDGVVWDTPYVLDGGGVDRYPLVRFPGFEDRDPPMADAGLDVTVDQGSLVTLDGGGSRDNVGVVNYTWTFIYGGQDVIMHGATPSYRFDITGVYTITMNVTDAAGNWAMATVNVTVRDPTDPVAIISVLTSVELHETVTFDGSNSRDNVGIVNWTWSFEYDNEQVELYGETTVFVFAIAGSYLVELRVTDAQGNWATDTMLLSVRDTDPPWADAGEDVVIEQGATVTFDGTNSTDNLGIVSYMWTFESAGESHTLDGPKLGHTFEVAGEYVVTLRIADEAGNSANDTVMVTVLDTEPPVARAGGNVTLQQGEPIRMYADFSTDNVAIVGNKWVLEVAGKTVEYEEVSITLTFPDAGVFRATLIVWDAAGNNDTDSITITVLDGTPPVAIIQGDRTVLQTMNVILDASGSTDNVGITSYHWRFEVNDMEMNRFGALQTLSFSTPGTYEIHLTIHDAADNSAVAHFNLTVRDAFAPNLPALRDMEVGVGKRVTLDGSGAIDNVGVVSWIWTFKEGEGTVTLEGERVEYTFEEIGDYQVTLTVTDSEGLMTSTTFDVHVWGSNTIWVMLSLAAVFVAAVLLFILTRGRLGGGD